MQERNLLLGIDPSFVTMGAAIYNPETRNLNLGGGDFDDCIQWIGKNCNLKNVIAIVEDPNLNKNVFGMWAIMEKAINKKRVPGLGQQFDQDTPQSVFSRCMMHAQKVGQNKAAAKLILKMLTKYNVPIISVSPSDRDKGFKEDKRTGKKVELNPLRLKMPTKLTASQFSELTGYQGSSNEHNRDAATLLWGRSMTWAINMVLIDQEKNRTKPGSFPGHGNSNYSLFNK